MAGVHRRNTTWNVETYRRSIDLVSEPGGSGTILGLKPFEIDSVDLTHVRAMFRLTGEDAPRLIAKLCALDLDERMFPDGVPPLAACLRASLPS